MMRFLDSRQMPVEKKNRRKGVAVSMADATLDFSDSGNVLTSQHTARTRP